MEEAIQEAPKTRSTSTQTLIAQIANLTKENEALKAESKKHRIGKREFGEEAAQLRAELEKATKERDHFKKKVESTPDEVRQELDVLRGELRMTRHKDAFTRIAREAGIRDEAVEDAFHLSGYQPDGDEVDPDAIRGVVNQTLASRPYLKGEPAKPKLTAGPGASRGSTTKGGFAPTIDQLKDPAWMFANQDKVAAAYSSGTLQIND